MRCRSAKLAQFIVRHLLKTFAKLVDIEGFQLNLLHNVLNLIADPANRRTLGRESARSSGKAQVHRTDSGEMPV
jgi:hypothetical protein